MRTITIDEQDASKLMEYLDCAIMFCDQKVEKLSKDDYRIWADLIASWNDRGKECMSWRMKFQKIAYGY